MKIGLVVLVVALAGVAEAGKKGGSLYVQGGYTKKNGTYVAPHIKTVPDKNPYNNYGAVKAPKGKK